MRYTEYPITPNTKPRMTRSDKWKERPPVMRYRAFKDLLRFSNFKIPYDNYHMVLVFPMPDSWDESRRDKMRGMPHKNTPDKDNCEKALLDAVLKQDSVVWDGRVTKFWGDSGAIVVIEIENKIRSIYDLGNFDCCKDRYL